MGFRGIGDVKSLDKEGEGKGNCFVRWLWRCYCCLWSKSIKIELNVMLRFRVRNMKVLYIF